MVTKNIPKINSEVRKEIKLIFDNQLSLMLHKESKFFTYDSEIYSENFIYHNDYSFTHQNIAYINNIPSMSVFTFGLKNIIKIYTLLDIKNIKPKLNGIRVYSNIKIPMHRDIDKYNNGRNCEILSISLSESNGYIFFSNKKDGSIQTIISSNTDFIFNPNDIVHGAKSDNVSIDLLQIQL